MAPSPSALSSSVKHGRLLSRALIHSRDLSHLGVDDFQGLFSGLLWISDPYSRLFLGTPHELLAGSSKGANTTMINYVFLSQERTPPLEKPPWLNEPPSTPLPQTKTYNALLTPLCSPCPWTASPSSRPPAFLSPPLLVTAGLSLDLLAHFFASSIPRPPS